MKKMLSLIVLMTGIYLSSFSQSKYSLQTEPFNHFPPQMNMERFRLGDTTLKGSLNNPLSGKNFIYPKFPEKNRSFSQSQTNGVSSSRFFGKMPCLKPQGNFPMPVYQPDSTIRFSLLIKKY